MEPATKHEVTLLLSAWRQDDQSALNQLVPLVEAELRRLARSYMRNERPGHTLQPTALINEAWIRFASESGQPDFKGRPHFIAIAAHHMRQILVEHARRKKAGKRGGAEARPVELDDAHVSAGAPPDSDLIRLDDGLNDLARLDGRQAQIVELHYFGGLSFEEIADFLEIGRSTVIRDLRMAQAWLKNYVEK